MKRFYSIHGVLFVLHRLTGLLLLGYLVLHLVTIGMALIGGRPLFDATMAMLASPPFLAAEVAIVGCLVFHALNGLRIIAVERGIGIRAADRWAWGVSGATAAIWLAASVYLATA